MHFLEAALPVWPPAVDVVEALRPLIADQDPECGVGEPVIDKAPSSVMKKHPSCSMTPPVRMNVESIEFACCSHVGIRTWADGGESADDVSLHRHDGRWLSRFYLSEGVASSTFGGLECIEILVGQQPSVRPLPGSDVDLGDGIDVSGRGPTEQHA